MVTEAEIRVSFGGGWGGGRYWFYGTYVVVVAPNSSAELQRQRQLRVCRALQVQHHQSQDVVLQQTTVSLFHRSSGCVDQEVWQRLI